MTIKKLSIALAATVFALLSIGKVALSQTDDRIALVIGNSNYSSVPALDNPINDAFDMGAALERLDFEVTVRTDLDAFDMNKALGSFARRARNAKMAVLFFAGHGVEVDKKNYLIPINTEIEQAEDLSFQAIPLDLLLKAVDGAEELKLVLLDACRDNPFNYRVVGASRSLGRGLSRVEPPGGVLVGYAAREGTIAYDGEGRNSPYTKALLQYIEEPGLEIGKLFRKVRDAVYTDTGGAQEPFTYGSLPSHDIFLAGLSTDTISEDFERASAIGDPEAWDAFLRKYDNDTSNRSFVLAARKLREAAAERKQGNLRLNLPSTDLDDALGRASAPSPVAEENALELSLDNRRAVQRHLQSLGYDPGPDDGVFGSKTRTAIASFQEEVGLQNTGFATRETLAEIISVYRSAPITLDGKWRLTLQRRKIKTEPGRNDAVGLVSTMGFVDFLVKGTKIETLETGNFSSAPNPKDPDLRATITEDDRLEVSVVINYDFFTDEYRRVFASIELPNRVRVGQEFVRTGSRLNNTYQFQGILRRISTE